MVEKQEGGEDNRGGKLSSISILDLGGIESTVCGCAVYFCSNQLPGLFSLPCL